MGEKSYSFQIVEVLPQVLLIFCLIFIHFELGVAYQSAAYKKTCILFLINSLHERKCLFATRSAFYREIV